MTRTIQTWSKWSTMSAPAACLADEGQREGHAEGAAELADGLVGAAADAAALGRERLGHRAGQLRQDQGDGDAGEDHRREEVPPVGGGVAQDEHPPEAGGGVHEAAGDEQRALADPAGELAEPRGEDGDQQRARASRRVRPGGWSSPTPRSRNSSEPRNMAVKAMPKAKVATLAQR